MRRRSAISNKPRAAAITTAARALVGRFCIKFGASNNSNAIATAPTTPVSWVRAPDASATGVREELLLIGKPLKKPAARFATPRPIISWFGSTYIRVLAAYVRDKTLVSANDTSATAQPPITTAPRSAKLIKGTAKDGRPCGKG